MSNATACKEGTARLGTCLQPDILACAKVAAERALIEEVAAALRASGYASLRRVEVETLRGFVILSGRVPCWHEKQVAQAAAQQVPGVRGVANVLEVVRQHASGPRPR